MQVTVGYFIPPLQIENLFVSAFEGGSNYWVRGADLKASSFTPRAGIIWWGQEHIYKGSFRVELQYDDPDKEEGNGEGLMSFTQADVESALARMATKFPNRFAEILNEEADQLTADIFLQCIVFAEHVEKKGDVVYG